MGIKQFKTKNKKVKWSAYYRDPTGKQRTVPGGPWLRKADALDAERAMQHKLRAQQWIDPELGKATVKTWSQQWEAARTVERGTAKKVRSHLDAQILPYWGTWSVAAIRPLDVRTWIATMAPKLQPETVRGVYATFSSLMTGAVENGMRASTPCDRGTTAALPRGMSKAVFLTPEQVDMLVAYAPDAYRALIATLAYTGLRWGEVAALEWSAVELDRQPVPRIHVRQAYKRSEGVIGSTKNKQARAVALDARCVAVLREQCEVSGGGKFVFPAPSGGVLDYDAARRMFAKLGESCFLDPRPTFHDLRHTRISALLNDGFDVQTVQRQAGHATAGFTLDRYGHGRHSEDDYIAAKFAEKNEVTS